jgi:hypothetical protein
MSDRIETATATVRRFLGMSADEPTELTFFCEGRIFLAQSRTAQDHVRLLREAERMSGFNGAYQLVNGPLNPQIYARYEPNKIHKAWNGRANDTVIQSLRAIFFDCDPERLKGISATDEEKRAACEVADAVVAMFSSAVGANAVGRGDSGNGYFVLVAISPIPPTAETTTKISKLLGLLNKKFGREKVVKIDTSVSNPARLMPAAGTWKRKGWNSPERPHRLTSFTCSETVERVPLEVLCG